MSKSADAHGPKRAHPDAELEPMAPAGSGGFAPVPARRAAALQPEVTAAPLITGGETTQYQVPLDLLVLARNKEKDKARSVAVTPVAPKPNSDEPPPSSELSGLRTEQHAGPDPAAPASSRPVPAASPLPSPRATPLAEAGGEARHELAPGAASSSTATLALVVLVAICLFAGYYAVELLRLF